MRKPSLLIGLLSSLLLALPAAHAAVLPGYGQVTGTVTGDDGRVLKVYLHNAQKNVGYAVFAVDGKFRAVNLLPGRYDISLRTAGFELAPMAIEVAADASASVRLVPKKVPAAPDYTGGITYPDAKVETYDQVYPAGEGRRIVERTCIVCHGVNWLPSLRYPRPAWEAFVHYMTSEPAFRKKNIAGGSLMDPALLGERDRQVVLDYLAANFGPTARLRAVQQEQEPKLDRAALAKAMFIEYRFPNSKEMPGRFTQEVHFDPKGNVFSTNPSKPASIIRLDPRTGATKTFFTPDPKSYPHGLTVDFDGTVWWAGSHNYLAHLDPETGLTDEYKGTETGAYGQTVTFAPNGDLWFSILLGNKLGHWNRATDKATYYETPAPRGRPYGTVVDRQGKVWYAEWLAGHIVRFDPETKKFTQFRIQSSPAMMRRLGIDSKGIVWFGVYGRVGKNGHLGRLDPATGKVTEIEMPIQYANPYDAWADDKDRIWISADNYLSRFDPATRRFTIYPTPERTDMPKLMITRDGAIWYAPRSAGWAGYGGAAAVLYPDMDAIPTLGAFHSPNSIASYGMRVRGPSIRVTGKPKFFKDGPQNPEMPGERTVGRPLEGVSPERADAYNNRNVE